MLKIIVLVLFALLTVLFTNKTTQSNSNLESSFQVFIKPSLERISQKIDNQQFNLNLFNQNNRDNNSTENNLQLYAAKGEYESLQIVIQSPKGRNLQGVNVVVADLQNNNQDLISSQNITLYREHYVYVDTPSPNNLRGNPTLGQGWYPDGLIPFVNPNTGLDLEGAKLDAAPFNVLENENQSIWLDIYVPRDTKPGEYQGSYTVTTDHQGEKRGKINLTVWDFELPLKPTMNSHFIPWQERGENLTEELLKHKVVTGLHVRPEQQQELINQWGLNSVRLPFWSGANYTNCQMSPAPSVIEIKQAADVYDDSLLKYIYSADEIDECKNLISPLKQWADNIHEAGIKHLVVMKPRPELYEDVDIWVIQPNMYETGDAEITEAMKQGDQVWFYSGYHTDYSPQWTIDALPINFRIPQGFIAPNLGLTGILYFRIDAWGHDPNKITANPSVPWYRLPVYQYSNERSFPGDGALIYPGEEVGLKEVVPSLRLKRIRDGMEDYEYIAILKNFGEEAWALKTIQPVASNWHNWTKEPQVLEETRVKLGNRIQELMHNYHK